MAKQIGSRSANKGRVVAEKTYRLITRPTEHLAVLARLVVVVEVQSSLMPSPTRWALTDRAQATLRPCEVICEGRRTVGISTVRMGSAQSAPLIFALATFDHARPIVIAIVQ